MSLTVVCVVSEKQKFMKIQKCVGKCFSHIKQSVHKEQMDSSFFVSSCSSSGGNRDGPTRTGSEGRTQQGQTVKVNQSEEETKMCALQIKITWEQQKAS